MRAILALAALVLAGVAIYNGDSSRGRITIIEQTLEENEIVAAEDEYENAPGRPSYVARLRVCVWKEEDGRDIRCVIDTERREYPSGEECSAAEWELVAGLAQQAEQRGFKLGARVACVQEYDA